MARYNTPLRYPGGKQKLTPFVAEIIRANNLTGCTYVEPYAGGAGVAMELLLNNEVDKISLNDSSEAVYAFWTSVLENTDALCSMISSASLTVEEWRKHFEIIRNPISVSILDLGYSLFYLNRCNRSGVVLGGVIGGLNQNGKWKIDARFPRNELIRRIENIAECKDRISLSNLDAENFIVSNSETFSKETLIYFDPPYINHSARLYLNNYKPADHARISKTIQTDTRSKWIVSYDYDIRIEEYYKERKMFAYDLQYNAAKVYKGRELFIFSDNLEIPNSSQFKPINDALNPMPRLFSH